MWTNYILKIPTDSNTETNDLTNAGAKAAL